MSTEVLLGAACPNPNAGSEAIAGLGALVSIMFFTVSGGAYGLEDVVGSSSAGGRLEDCGLFASVAPLRQTTDDVPGGTA